MKKTILVIMVLLLVGLGGVARSQTSTHVYGADDPAVDIQAVQDAVDTSDIVHLHGTFDFGDGMVQITRSVEILGEGKDAGGKYLTRIEGGGWGALRSSLDSTNVDWAVRDIEFDGASCAIQTMASKRFEVTGCSISLSSTGGGQGIQLSGPGGVWGTRVTGSVTIADNYIDLSGVAGGSQGIHAMMIYADIEIVGNTVENFAICGLWVNSAGNIEIEDNTITVGPAKPTNYRNGILVGTWFLGGDKGDIEVTDNTITTGGHEWDNGIVAEDWFQEARDVCKVEDNVITYVEDSPSGSGLLLLSRASFWTFRNNTINGGNHDLLAGIALYPEKSGEPGPQEYNVFADNRVSHANFVLGCVYVKGSDDGFGGSPDGHARFNEFIQNEFEHIGGDGFFLDVCCDENWIIENKFKHVTGDGIILKGNENIVCENKFKNIGGQHIVDDGVGNVIEDDD